MFTRTVYNREIDSIALALAEEAYNQLDSPTHEEVEELINDSIILLHEVIDGHEWVIYYHQNDYVLKHSDNSNAYEEVYDNESLGELVKEKGFDGAKMMMAYYAIYADVQEQLDWAIGNVLLEQAEELEK